MRPLFERVHYSICSEKIPPEFYGVRMVHLSDLHGAWFGKNHNVMIKAINNTNKKLAAFSTHEACGKTNVVKYKAEIF